MPELLIVLIAILAASCLVGVALILARLGRLSAAERLTGEAVAQLLRGETDILRRCGEEQARGVRQELGDAFEKRVGGIAQKLDGDIAKMGADATKNREDLRQLIEGKLQSAATSQLDQAKALREELNGSFHRLGGNVDKTLTDLGAQQKERLDATTVALQMLGEKNERSQEVFEQRVAAIAQKLDADIGKMGEEAARNREALRQLVETKLESAAAQQGEQAKALREELNGSFHRLGDRQKEGLEGATLAIQALGEKNEKSQEGLRLTVEGRLDVIRAESATKLEEMRQTVDEKLQSTLETRLGESFNRVVEQLNRVHEGLGEMKNLASNVGDLRNVLTNVKVRGTFGEVQLELILEQFLTPDQYIKDARVREHSSERVEFAIRFPGKGGGEEVLLPVDAKFPRESYERLLEASERGEAALIDLHRKQLQAQIRTCAKDIRDKYIHPPRTTDFALLFLPTEGLYAEVLRQPGMFEGLQRDYKVTLAGPTTLSAILNAFQMGFRSIAIERRSSEVWQILSAVQSEFGKYNAVVERLGKQLNSAVDSVGKLGTRARIMTRTLKTVEALPEGVSGPVLLGFDGEGPESGDEEGVASAPMMSEILVSADEA